MICAECGRCGRRSLLSDRQAPAPRTLLPGPGEDTPRLRCDLCGSRRVRVVEFDSPFAAVSFVTGRGSGR
ncbi:hypothetical protein V5F49_10335 [Xanthobacter sp. V3C-3]|uniref:hypothetical protein n=1 Tax=Xanthobacter lutulentifluminis TaxID=3119935 RepID=UPI00372C353A